MPLFTEEARLAMMRALEALPDKPWREIGSELQRGGAELPIWVLVQSRDQIAPAFDLIRRTTAPFRADAPGTDVSLSFDQFEGGRLIHWNHVEPSEVRSGQTLLPLGADPMELGQDPAESVYRTVRDALGAERG